jgi:hypothetical protein
VLVERAAAPEEATSSCVMVEKAKIDGWWLARAQRDVTQN